MEKVILFLMGLGALAGGADRLLGNRLGLGARFEEGFRLLGPVALCQAGMIVVAPLLSSLLSRAVVPLFHFMQVDPGMFGAVLAIDMGGFQMAQALADSGAVGRFAGIVAASTLGCTLTYTIPVGIGLVPERLHDAFARGVMCGVIVQPAALFVGGLLCSLSPLTSLLCEVPVLLLSLLLCLGLMKRQAATIRAFRVFASLIRALTTLGLALGAFRSLSGIELVPGLESLETAMGIVSGIGIALLGSLPAAEVLQRALRVPLRWLGQRLGADDRAVGGMLLSAVNITPALAAMGEMDEKGARLTAAFAVSAASALTAHLGFAASLAPDLAMPMLAAKFLGGILAAALALLLPFPEGNGGKRGKENGKKAGKPER